MRGRFALLRAGQGRKIEGKLRPLPSGGNTLELDLNIRNIGHLRTLDHSFFF